MSKLFSSEFLTRLERLAVRARRPAAGLTYGRGRGRASVGSGGLEFVDVREYSPGDDLRAVDWNLFARLDKLLLRVYRQEREHDVHILLDVSESMMTENKYLRAMQFAAGLAYIGLSRLDRVAVWPIAEGGMRPPFPLAAGKRRIATLFRYLEELKAGGQTDLPAAVSTFCRLAPSRGVAVVISDFYDLNSRDGLRGLLSAGFEVHAIQVLGAEDTAPAAEGRLELVDVETGRVVRGRVGPAVRASYEELLEQERQAMARMLGATGGAFVTARPHRKLEDVLLRDLRRAGVLE